METIIFTISRDTQEKDQVFCDFIVGGDRQYSIDISKGAQYSWKIDPQSVFFFDDETVIQVLSDFAENHKEKQCANKIISDSVAYQLSFIPTIDVECYETCKEKNTFENIGTFLLQAEMVHKSGRVRQPSEKLYLIATETERYGVSGMQLFKIKLQRVLDAYQNTKKLADELCAEQKILCKKIQELEEKDARNQLELQTLKVAVFGMGFSKTTKYCIEKSFISGNIIGGQAIYRHNENINENCAIIFFRGHSNDYIIYVNNNKTRFKWGELYSFLLSHPRMMLYKHLLSNNDHDHMKISVPVSSLKLTKEQEEFWIKLGYPSFTISNNSSYINYLHTEYNKSKSNMSLVLGKEHSFLKDMENIAQIGFLLRDLLFEFQFRGKIIVPIISRDPSDITYIDHPTDPNYVNTFCSEQFFLNPESFSNSRMFYHDYMGFYTTPLYPIN
jgi:hypothetical protein